jgi:DNA-binding NarL/FixJ family response regulator
VIVGDPTEPLELLLSGVARRPRRLFHRNPLPVGASRFPCNEIQEASTIATVPLRLLIADPQPLFCESLAHCLDAEPEIEVLGWTTDERRAARLAESGHPTFVLTEVELARGSGLHLTRRVRGTADVVVLTRRHESDVLMDAVSAGAVGCLSHSLGPTEIARLLRDGVEGGFISEPRHLLEALRATATRGTSAGADAPLARLTPREREVLALLAAGGGNRDIADALYLSPETARTHVRNLLRKLGVHSRADAARLALRSGLGGPDVGVLRIQGPDLGPR